MHLLWSIRLLGFVLSGFCTTQMAFADLADVQVCPLEEAMKRMTGFAPSRAISLS